MSERRAKRGNESRLPRTIIEHPRPVRHDVPLVTPEDTDFATFLDDELDEDDRPRTGRGEAPE